MTPEDSLIVGARVRDIRARRGRGTIIARWENAGRELLRVKWDSAHLGLPDSSVRELHEVKLETES